MYSSRIFISLFAGEFPSPEDWDNEEYTGSLADSKVFTPSTTVEPETVEAAPAVESEIKEDSLALQMSLQSSPSVSIYHVQTLTFILINSFSNNEIYVAIFLLFKSIETIVYVSTKRSGFLILLIR